jgi:dihydroorotate dehydrogenase (fumarate)
MMPDLQTNYLGLPLDSPFLIGASPLVDTVEKVLRLEDAGAAGVVLHSLFEEQLTRDAVAAITQMETPADSYPEALSYFPDLGEYALGAEEYLEHISRLKARVSFPIIGSLNGRTEGGWLDYAKQIEQAGADALELNIYDVPTDPETSGSAIEERLFSIVRAVHANVGIPLSVKLAPFYTSLPHVVANLEKCGAQGVVLFNRFYQPDLHIENLEVEPRIFLSTSNELLLRLRWMAILHGRFRLSLGLSGGVHHVQDAIKGLMAGADVLQIVSLLLRQGVSALPRLKDGVSAWMTQHEYASVNQLRGSLSSRHTPDPGELERANYLRILQLWKD